jgi:hypothetical protein
MIDHYLRKINGAVIDRSLDDLESDVWRGVAGRERARSAARKRVSAQGVILLVALIGSIAVGILSSRTAGLAHGHLVLPLGVGLTPSSLLLGST